MDVTPDYVYDMFTKAGCKISGGQNSIDIGLYGDASIRLMEEDVTKAIQYLHNQPQPMSMPAPHVKHPHDHVSVVCIACCFLVCILSKGSFICTDSWLSCSQAKAIFLNHNDVAVFMNGTQRRALINPWRMHCMYSGMAKDTSRAEVTSNSEKIKPVALAIVELHESEGIRQLVSQSVSRKFC